MHSERLLIRSSAAAVFLAALLIGAISGADAESRHAEARQRLAIALDADRGARWEPPLGRPLRVVEPFRQPEHRYGPGHRGIDVLAQSSRSVVASAGGTVSFSGTVVDREVISIRVDSRTVVSMEPVASELEEGGSVRRGQVVGEIESGGHCGSSCLHLGVRVDGEYVNPMRFFAGKPVLLPWEPAPE